MKNGNLIHKVLSSFLYCTAVIFILTTPLFFLLTKYFYVEDLMDVIQAVKHGNGIPPLDLESDILAGMMLQFTLTFIVLSIALFITIRFITKRLWRPFDNTLAKVENFSIVQNEAPDFEPTGIIEFDRLNKTLYALIRKNKEAYRIQKEFTENASHELQTPLAVTRSKLDLLMQENLSEQQLHLVAELYQLNTRMGHLNRNLLLLSKIENSQYTHFETISINEFIGDLIPSYNLISKNCPIHFKTSTNQRPVVKANPILLECMLNNLVINAIRHTSSGDICILTDDVPILNISNPAEGNILNPDDIFRRFRSCDSRNRGNGLGLAIVKAICDFHGWSVEYSSHDNRHCFTIKFS